MKTQKNGRRLRKETRLQEFIRHIFLTLDLLVGPLEILPVSYSIATKHTYGYRKEHTYTVDLTVIVPPRKKQ